MYPVRRTLYFQTDRERDKERGGTYNTKNRGNLRNPERIISKEGTKLLGKKTSKEVGGM